MVLDIGLMAGGLGNGSSLGNVYLDALLDRRSAFTTGGDTPVHAHSCRSVQACSGLRLGPRGESPARVRVDSSPRWSGEKNTFFHFIEFTAFMKFIAFIAFIAFITFIAFIEFMKFKHNYIAAGLRDFLFSVCIFSISI